MSESKIKSFHKYLDEEINLYNKYSKDKFSANILNDQFRRLIKYHQKLETYLKQRESDVLTPKLELNIKKAYSKRITIIKELVIIEPLMSYNIFIAIWNSHTDRKQQQIYNTWSKSDWHLYRHNIVIYCQYINENRLK